MDVLGMRMVAPGLQPLQRFHQATERWRRRADTERVHQQGNDPLPALHHARTLGACGAAGCHAQSWEHFCLTSVRSRKEASLKPSAAFFLSSWIFSHQPLQLLLLSDGGAELLLADERFGPSERDPSSSGTAQEGEEAGATLGPAKRPRAQTLMEGRTAVKPAAEPPESCVPLPALGRPPQPAVVRRQTLGPAVSAPSFSVEFNARDLQLVPPWDENDHALIVAVR
ncbi:hypothetical protein FQA47_024522 [Oryzias melastigma]|uniref:Uncharacterized protein n=1 Tax=Oryzias melastigma TaxID=30732 RepID=A0A834KYL3_ORYME|nr:hypothetical protein FQA47_024522 [Oryzias melastigma]